MLNNEQYVLFSNIENQNYFYQLSGMKNRYKVIFFSIFIVTLLPIDIKAQEESRYEKGEVEFVNSGLVQGLIWLVSSSDGSNSIYYKFDVTSIAQNYSPDDITLFRIFKGDKTFISDDVIINDISQRIFVQVHFTGEYNLYSYLDPFKKVFYIKDSLKNNIELQNTHIMPGNLNNYEIAYKREYIEVLKSLFGLDTKFLKYIEDTEYSVQSINELLTRFHETKNLDFRQYPAPLMGGWFTGGGISYTNLTHVSAINDSFISKSPFVRISMFGGLILFKELIEASFEVSYSYGIIFHDNHIDESGNITHYYEDIVRASILGPEVNFGIKPVNLGRISTTISVGINYNLLHNYSRALTEEILYNDFNYVEKSYFVEFQKPSNFFGFDIEVGVSYEIAKSSSFKLSYRYNHFLDSEAGFQKMQNASISFIKYFKK